MTSARSGGGKALEIDYEGNGFLQQMVRILTGTLIEVGLGKRSAGEMTQILEAKNRQAAGVYPLRLRDFA